MIMIIWNATDPTAESDYIKRTQWLVGVQNSEHFSPTVWLKQLHSNCMLYSLHNTRWYWQLRELQRTFKQQNTVKDKTAETPNKWQIAWKKERNTQNASSSIICIPFICHRHHRHVCVKNFCQVYFFAEWVKKMHIYVIVNYQDFPIFSSNFKILKF